MQWPGMVSVYAVLGSHHPRITTTGAHQVGIDFSGHRGLVCEVDGRVRRHNAEAGAVYVTGSSPITWLEVTDPAEALEIYPDRALLDRLAGRNAEVRPSFAVHDGVVFAVASRLRRAHLTAGALTDVEASTLAHLLVRHLLRRYGTGSPPNRRPAGQLQPGAVDVVAEYVHAHLADEITLDALAAAVNLSTYHFARSFRATTGLTPHAFVTEHRLMVARDRLLRGDASVAAIGLSVGFSNISHFRRLFRRRYGLTPADLRLDWAWAEEAERGQQVVAEGPGQLPPDGVNVPGASLTASGTTSQLGAGQGRTVVAPVSHHGSRTACRLQFRSHLGLGRGQRLADDLVAGLLDGAGVAEQAGAAGLGDGLHGGRRHLPGGDGPGLVQHHDADRAEDSSAW